MQAAKPDTKPGNPTRTIVTGLVITAVIVWTAGLLHQKRQQDAAVNWHQVSTAMMEVESAKRDLHQSLQERIGREQQAPSLRQN